MVTALRMRCSSATAACLLLLLQLCGRAHARQALHGSSSFCFAATRREALSREARNGPPNDFHHGGANGKIWYQNNAEPSIRCLTDERVGPHGDGGKWLCQPDCLLVRNNCTMLSVGSNNEFGVEEALEPFGCNIHIFDHTVAKPTPPAHVHFHPYGLDVRSAGQMRTLREMAALAGFTGVGVIDVFKIGAAPLRSAARACQSVGARSERGGGGPSFRP